MNRAAFLDRDGVINRKPPAEDIYVTRWEEMQVFPDVAPAISLLNRAGLLVIIVSNQRCVAKGLITSDELDAIHQRLCDELAREGATIHGVYYCPHELQPPCGCRKPQPGMLLQAAWVHDIDLSASWMIGDSEKDVEAGKRAGCKTVRLLRDGDSERGGADSDAQSLLDATHTILRWHEVTGPGSAPTLTGKQAS